jgi:hypothetical protein
MVQIAMETAPEAHVSRQVLTAGIGAIDTSLIDPVVGGSIDSVREEIDEAYADIKTFHNREPDEVFRMVSGHSGRLAELRGRIYRVENFARQWQPIRAREIEPALDELAKQYQIASRLLTVRELDWKMETGGR